MNDEGFAVFACAGDFEGWDGEDGGIGVEAVEGGLVAY